MKVVVKKAGQSLNLKIERKNEHVKEKQVSVGVPVSLLASDTLNKMLKIGRMLAIKFPIQMCFYLRLLLLDCRI